MYCTSLKRSSVNKLLVALAYRKDLNVYYEGPLARTSLDYRDHVFSLLIFLNPPSTFLFVSLSSVFCFLIVFFEPISLITFFLFYTHIIHSLCSFVYFSASTLFLLNSFTLILLNMLSILKRSVWRKFYASGCLNFQIWKS